MDSRASTRTRLSVLPVFIALLLNILMVGPMATAPSRTLALTGSTFDATDGNLAVDGAESDWCTDPGSVVRKDDAGRADCRRRQWTVHERGVISTESIVDRSSWSVNGLLITALNP